MENKSHKKINEKKKLEMQTYPMLASVHWKFEDDTDEDMQKWFNDFIRLDVVIKYGLASPMVSKEIFKMSQIRDIKDKEQIGEISRIIREVFTRHINEEDIVKRVINKLKISKDKVDDFMVDLRFILTLVKKEGQRIKEEEEKGSPSEMIAIIPAMEKYKEVGEQLISLEPIRLELFDVPVRPSIKNWLEDYRETIGTDKSSIKRSSYLFTSANAKGLGQEDRKKVSLILKSYNDSTKIVVDSQKGLVDFERSFKQGGGAKNEQFKNKQNLEQNKKDDIFIKSEKGIELEEKTETKLSNAQEVNYGPRNSMVKSRDYKKAELVKKPNNDKVDLQKKKLEKKTNEKKANNLLDLSEY